jgi:beta-glucosidase-like glycosyl hydrolase
MPILMAAAFDDDLIKRVAESIGTEARAFGNAGFGGLDYWTPTINPYRDPVCEHHGLLICFLSPWHHGRKAD